MHWSALAEPIVSLNVMNSKLKISSKAIVLNQDLGVRKVPDRHQLVPSSNILDLVRWNHDIRQNHERVSVVVPAITRMSVRTFKSALPPLESRYGLFARHRLRGDSLASLLQ